STNFTGERRIAFYDNTSWFNYNNKTSGNIWLKTSITINALQGIKRTFVTWSHPQMKWNDTNTSSGVVTLYNITGLLSYATYKVYNTSAGVQTNPYTFETGAGNAISFTIALNDNTEILVNTTGSDYSPAVSSLNYPPDNSNFTAGTLWLNATGYDDFNLTAMELNVWNSTSLVNQTNITNPANSTMIGMQVTLPNGTYRWNYKAYDNATHTGWFASNYTFTIDSVPPTSNAPDDAAHAQNSSSTLNWTLYDNYAPGYYTMYRNGTVQNVSMWQNNTNLNVWVNTSTIGMWNYTISYNDSLGNNGIPDTVIITVTTWPAITFLPPTLPGNSTSVSNWIFVNVTASEGLNQSLLEWGNSTGFTNVSMANSSATNWYANMTGLSDEVYNYTVRAENLVGNWNNTGLMTLTVDAVSPFYWDTPSECNIDIQKIDTNATIYATCNVTVNGSVGASLSLNNVTFFMNQSANYQYSLNISPGAFFNATSSNFTATNTVYDFNIFHEGNSTLTNNIFMDRIDQYFQANSINTIDNGTFGIIYSTVTIRGTSMTNLKNVYIRYMTFELDQAGHNATVDGIITGVYFSKAYVVNSTSGFHVNLSNSKMGSDGGKINIYGGDNVYFNNTLLGVYSSITIDVPNLNVRMSNSSSKLYFNYDADVVNVYFEKPQSSIYYFEVRGSGASPKYNLSGYVDMPATTASVSWIYPTISVNRFFPFYIKYTSGASVNVTLKENGTVYTTSGMTDTNGLVNLNITFTESTIGTNY
ncbi:hypothetical protein L6303_07315, partial [archaeon]|nr:hypothetical protein [archaeon]